MRRRTKKALKILMIQFSPQLRILFRSVPGGFLKPLARRGMWELLPEGRDVIKDNYLDSFAIQIDTRYPMERKLCRAHYHSEIQPWWRASAGPASLAWILEQTPVQ